MVRSALYLTFLVVAACSSGSETPAGTPTGSDAGARVLDPETFDCRAPGVPSRVSATPVACGLDRRCRTRQVTGHRGAGGELGKVAPEDTLAAYRAGIALGVDYVETDPRPTSDGVLVNMHDATVDRTTDGSGQVDQMTFEQIRALHIDAAAYAGDFTCERVPTLEEILSTCKGRVIVLVDANKTDRVDLLVRAIQMTDTIDWAIFDTSSVDRIDQALALEPGLHTQIRTTSVDDATAQLDHFAAHPPVVVEIESTAPIADVASAVHARDNRATTDVFAYDLAVDLDADLSHYGEAFALGPDIVESDRPDLVLQYLGR